MAPRLKLFNLIVSHEPGWRNARAVVDMLKQVLGHVRIFDTPQSLVLASVSDPFHAVEALRAKLGPSDPVLRVIPLAALTYPFVDYVAEIVREQAEKTIPEKATFAIKLEGYLYERSTGRRLHKREAIDKIAEGIERDVNLSSPDFLVLVKVVRVHRAQRYAGIMVAPPSSIYSASKRGGEA